MDQLNIIQLGLTFATPFNAKKYNTRTWQFNFYFDVDKDSYHKDSIELLRKANINLEDHKNKGIDPQLFGYYFTTSGIVCNEKMTWTTFHASYDFGYMMKILTNNLLPRTEGEFMESMKTFFPVVYDLKVMTQTKGGLNKLAEEYNVKRKGDMHQAGSDSLLTVETFQSYVKNVLNGKVDTKYKNQIAGLKSDRSNTTQDYQSSHVYGRIYGPNYLPSFPDNRKIYNLKNTIVRKHGVSKDRSSSPVLPSSSLSSSNLSTVNGTGYGYNPANTFSPHSSIIGNPSLSAGPDGLSTGTGMGGIPSQSPSMLAQSQSNTLFFPSRMSPSSASPNSADSQNILYSRDFQPIPMQQMGMNQFSQLPLSMNTFALTGMGGGTIGSISSLGGIGRIVQPDMNGMMGPTLDLSQTQGQTNNAFLQISSNSHPQMGGQSNTPNGSNGGLQIPGNSISPSLKKY